MKHFSAVACVLAIQCLLICSSHAADWKLIWSDEFDRPGSPDPTKWGYEEGFVRNGEAQDYTRSRLDNARVEDGMLVIEARKEPLAGAPGQRPIQYTSASLTTQGKASWTYGRIEVRAKLPQGRGMWPAIWTLGDDMPAVHWPACGEIDIMEFIGVAPDLIHGTVHYSNGGHHAASGSTIPIVNAANGFHTYAIEWWPDRIDFFFDGTKYHGFAVAKAGAGQDNPFNKPQYLILNLALGGSWGGPIDDTALPQKFLIDYVRVYQQPR